MLRNSTLDVPGTMPGEYCRKGAGFSLGMGKGGCGHTALLKTQREPGQPFLRGLCSTFNSLRLETGLGRRSHKCTQPHSCLTQCIPGMLSSPAAGHRLPPEPAGRVSPARQTRLRVYLAEISAQGRAQARWGCRPVPCERRGAAARGPGPRPGREAPLPALPPGPGHRRVPSATARPRPALRGPHRRDSAGTR